MQPRGALADRKIIGDSKAMPSLGVRIAGVLLVVTALFVLIEVCLSLLPRFVGTSLRSVIYLPPDITRARYESFLQVQDPLVGWPLRHERIAGRPAARPSPAFADARDWCVTLYGDSFTFGDEVTDADAWGNVLAQRLGCPVGNFGVGGYGTDQALLWFTENTADHAAATVVGIFTDNPLRNVNQYRHLLTGAEPFGLKPRFLVEHGSPRLITMPTLSYEQLVEGLREPQRILPHDAFLPGSPHGPVIWSFPYAASLIRLLRSDQVINYVRGRPTWIDFYRPDHDSGALSTTVAIIEEFRRRRGPAKSLVVVLFPSGASYNLNLATGESAFAPLVAALDERGIRSRDLTQDIATYLGERSFCELLTDPDRCTGHYNAEGNRVVAVAAHKLLANRIPGAAAR
jgi:hypothetical protein